MKEEHYRIYGILLKQNLEKYTELNTRNHKNENKSITHLNKELVKEQQSKPKKAGGRN